MTIEMVWTAIVLAGIAWMVVDWYKSAAPPDLDDEECDTGNCRHVR
jgi:hypothetical protein